MKKIIIEKDGWGYILDDESTTDSLKLHIKDRKNALEIGLGDINVDFIIEDRREKCKHIWNPNKYQCELCGFEPTQNYVDSLTPEERKQQYNMETTISTATSTQEPMNWEEELQLEIMEDYLLDAQMGGGELKNKYMQENFEKLKQFIREVVKEERERIIKEIEKQLVPDEITASSNPRWVYNKAKKDIINLIENK